MILWIICLKRERKWLDLIKLDVSVFSKCFNLENCWMKVVCVCVRGDLSMGWLCSSLISTWKGAISYFCRPDMESQVSNRGLAAYGCGQPCLGWVLFSTSLGGEDGDAHAREGKCSWSRASLLQQHHGSCEHRQVHPSHHQQPEEITHVLGWWAAHRPQPDRFTPPNQVTL